MKKLGGTRRVSLVNPVDGASLMDDGDSSRVILPAGDAAGATADTMLMIVRARPADGVDEKEEVGNRQKLASYSNRVSQDQSDDFQMLPRIGDGQTMRNLGEPVVEDQTLMVQPAMPLYASRTAKLGGYHFLQRYSRFQLPMTMTELVLARCN